MPKGERNKINEPRSRSGPPAAPEYISEIQDESQE